VEHASLPRSFFEALAMLAAGGMRAGTFLAAQASMLAVLFEQILEIQDPEPHDAPLNMAIDEALLQRATQPTLRIYGWRERALSLGYFSRHAEAEETAAGRTMVRRWTGGGLVEHGDDITYTLIVPTGSHLLRHNAAESYRLIHEGIAQWLNAHGLQAHVLAALPADAAASACFVRPVQYDILARERKIAGAAQRRTRWGLLHQGSIQAPVEMRAHTGTLAAVFGGEVARGEITVEIQESAEQIARDRYATDAWLRKF